MPKKEEPPSVDFTVESFESPEQMFESIRSNLNSADLRVTDQQKQAKPGDYFIRIANDVGIVIYGEILDPAVPQSDLSRYSDTEREEIAIEIREEANIYNEPHMKYMRFSKCYSVACEDGELGDTHCSTMHKFIKKETFELAREWGWPSEQDNVRYLLHETGELE